jgi:thiol:disulfide interchange protein
MIPITLGILGITDTTKRTDAMVRAFFYILGISTTFVVLGLLALSGKLIIGGLFSKKWFIIINIFFISYFTGSLLGFYDIKINNFLKFNTKKENEVKSFFECFFYGLFSGTITSPCVSPGLFALMALLIYFWLRIRIPLMAYECLSQ